MPVEQRGAFRIIEHEDRRTGIGSWQWRSVAIDGREVAIGMPWYDSPRAKFERAQPVAGGREAVVVKVLGPSRAHAWSHYATFLLERGAGGVSVTRLSPADPLADGADIDWPLPAPAAAR
ncbi:MAG TPA: hypothetical protein VF422_07275 [Dokdonella sp.]